MAKNYRSSRRTSSSRGSRRKSGYSKRKRTTRRTAPQQTVRLVIEHAPASSVARPDLPSRFQSTTPSNGKSKL